MSTERLTKNETVALWHAVQWMNDCLRAIRREAEGPDPSVDAEEERLAQAKRALRKVNELRKQGL